MKNLLVETRGAIGESGHEPSDIRFIGSRVSGHECSWEQFCALADVEYEEGFGGQEVCLDLEIVFTDGATMTRGEYDGSEWWAFSVPFNGSKAEPHPIKTLICGLWETLQEANEEPA